VEQLERAACRRLPPSESGPHSSQQAPGQTFGSQTLVTHFGAGLPLAWNIEPLALLGNTSVNLFTTVCGEDPMEVAGP
jgi:hypothetical protein